MKKFLLVIVVFNLGFTVVDSTRYSIKNYPDYRAAKYSIPIDYLAAHDIMGYSDPNPGDIPKYVTAYKHFQLRIAEVEYHAYVLMWLLCLNVTRLKLFHIPGMLNIQLSLTILFQI